MKLLANNILKYSIKTNNKKTTTKGRLLLVDFEFIPNSYLYHTTTIDKVPSILEKGLLLSKSREIKPEYPDSYKATYLATDIRAIFGTFTSNPTCVFNRSQANAVIKINNIASDGTILPNLWFKDFFHNPDTFETFINVFTLTDVPAKFLELVTISD